MPALAESRADHLHIVLDAWHEAYRAWQEGTENRLSPNDEFWRVTEELIEMFADGDLPGKLRGAAVTVEEMGKQWADFLERVDQYADPNLLPNQHFFKLADQLSEQKRQAEPRRQYALEPIHGPNGLLAQKVPYAQICNIYGWMDAPGQPQLWKLQEEIAEPGKHSDNAVNPLELRAMEKEAKEKAVVERLRNRVAKRVELANEPVRESIEDLARQGVYVTQIAKMHKTTPDKVLAEIKQLGIDVPPWDASADMARASAPEYPEGDVGEARRRVDEARQKPLSHSRRPKPDEDADEIPEPVLDDPGDVDALAELNAGDAEAAQAAEALGGLTLEQEIIQLHQDGESDAAIAEAMGESLGVKPGSRIGKVRNVLKDWRKNPEKYGGGKTPRNTAAGKAP